MSHNISHSFSLLTQNDSTDGAEDEGDGAAAGHDAGGGTGLGWSGGFGVLKVAAGSCGSGGIAG